MNTAAALLGILLGIPGAVAALHLLTLGVGSLFYREPAHPAVAIRFLALVPARDEAANIGGTLDRILEVKRPDDIVLVIADRCTDSTATIARGKGVEVLEYDGSHGSGKAAAMAHGLTNVADRPWDAMVNIDADSMIEHGFFEALESKLAEGYVAVQPRSEHDRGTNVLSRIAEAAFALQGVTIPRGRDRLGFAARLRGAGMTVTREVAMSTPFPTLGVSEDLFYGLQLVADGHRIGHVDTAALRSASAPTVSAGTRQKVRWETGRMAAARRYFRTLLKARTPSSIEAAIYLATPPIGLAVLSLLLGTALTLIAGWSTAATVFLTSIGAIALVVVIGLLQSRASWRTWLALVAAPVYVLWKAIIQAKAISGLGRADEAFERTDR